MWVRRAAGTKVVPLRLHQTRNKLNIIIISLLYKRHFSQHWIAGGSASNLGYGTLHPSLAESHLNPTCFIRPNTPPQHRDDKIWDFLFEKWSPNPQGNKANVPIVMYRPTLPREGQCRLLLGYSTAPCSRQLSRGESTLIFCHHHTSLGQRRYMPYILPMGASSITSKSIMP